MCLQIQSQLIISNHVRYISAIVVWISITNVLQVFNLNYIKIYMILTIPRVYVINNGYLGVHIGYIFKRTHSLIYRFGNSWYISIRAMIWYIWLLYAGCSFWQRCKGNIGGVISFATAVNSGYQNICIDPCQVTQIRGRNNTILISWYVGHVHHWLQHVGILRATVKNVIDISYNKPEKANWR